MCTPSMFPLNTIINRHDNIRAVNNIIKKITHFIATIITLNLVLISRETERRVKCVSKIHGTIIVYTTQIKKLLLNY